MNKKNMIFFDAPEDGGGGEGSKGLAAFDGDPIETEEIETETETPPTETPSVVAPTVDAGALAKQFGDILSERFKPPVQEEKKVDDLTPEEAGKLLNVWNPTKEWIAKFDNLETREAALKELRDGVVKNTDTITQYRIREALQGIKGEIGPALEFVQETRNRQAEERFGKAYPQLADAAMSPLIKAVAESLREQGKKYDSETALFDDLAKGVETVIKVSKPDFKLTPGSNPGTTTKTKSNNAIPVTTPGSGGGAGGGGRGETTSKKRGLSIFDPVTATKK